MAAGHAKLLKFRNQIKDGDQCWGPTQCKTVHETIRSSGLKAILYYYSFTHFPVMQQRAIN